MPRKLGSMTGNFNHKGLCHLNQRLKPQFSCQVHEAGIPAPQPGQGAHQAARKPAVRVVWLGTVIVVAGEDVTSADWDEEGWVVDLGLAF